MPPSRRLLSPTTAAAIGLASLAALATLLAPRAASATPRTISIDEVKPGMKGYGLTVFEGTKPDKFDVVVIGVLHNFLPKQDIILIRSEDPRLIHSGIVAGMSGSPIYLDGGRLAGALAYGWHFAKDPIAGVTPIAKMQADGERPLRGREHTPVSEAELLQPRKGLDEVLAAYKRDPSRRPLFMDHAPLPPLPGSDPSKLAPELVRASVPLSLAGFGAAAFSELGRALEPYHMTALAAGGTGPRRKTPNAPVAGPTKFEDGGSIAVDLVRGDMSAAGTGTVTLVDGNRVLAFGHPMFNVGELYLPVSTAEIHTFLSAYSSSFKFASPLNEIGSLVQDRQSCIVGDTSLRSDMIPIKVRVGGPGRPERVFEAEVVRHRFLTPMLVATAVLNAAQEAASDVADATVTVTTNLDVRGYSRLSLLDQSFSPDGVSQRMFTGTTGLKAIGDILFNQFAPAQLDRIDVAVDVDYRPDVAEITGLQLHTDELQPGSRPSLVVTLRPYNGPEYSESIPIEIPRALAGEQIKIEASAGNLVKPEVAPPENLGGLLANMTKSYPARAIVVTVQQPDEGLILRGSVVPELPPSVMDTLRPGASTRRGDTYKLSARVVVPTRGVVVGKHDLTVKVKELPAR